MRSRSYPGSPPPHVLPSISPSTQAPPRWSRRARAHPVNLPAPLKEHPPRERIPAVRPLAPIMFAPALSANVTSAVTAPSFHTKSSLDQAVAAKDGKKLPGDTAAAHGAAKVEKEHVQLLVGQGIVLEA